MKKEIRHITTVTERIQPIIKHTPQLYPAACILMSSCASILDSIPCCLLQQLLCDKIKIVCAYIVKGRDIISHPVLSKTKRAAIRRLWGIASILLLTAI